jgi:ribosomal protein S5
MGPRRVNKPKSEWAERVVSIERVTKVVKGGKKNELSSYRCRW